MGSRAGVNGVQETVLQEIQEDKEALLTIFMGNPKISVRLRKYGPLLEASCTRFSFLFFFCASYFGSTFPQHQINL